MINSESLFKETSNTETLAKPKNNSTKRIFIAATRMNDGKTTSSLGLYSALNCNNKRIGYIKPVGQRFIDLNGEKIDEDCFLLDQTFKVSTPIEAMSPIVVDKDFTKNYLEDSKKIYPIIVNRLCQSFDRAAYEKDYIIIEGTGHAGVGSVFNLSNAEVAKLLNAKVIIVASGGIGRPIDEIALNKSLFEKFGVEILGVIINKVETQKIDFIRKYCGIALANMGLKLLGCIPIESQLSTPSLSQIFDEIKAHSLNSNQTIKSKKIKKVIIGAKSAFNTIDDITESTLIITSSDREDILELCIQSNKASLISGIILTNSSKLSDKLMQKIKLSNIPFILSELNSYTLISKINKMNIKTQPDDNDKISIIQNIVKDNIDLSEIEKSFCL